MLKEIELFIHVLYASICDLSIILYKYLELREKHFVPNFTLLD